MGGPSFLRGPLHLFALRLLRSFEQRMREIMNTVPGVCSSPDSERGTRGPARTAAGAMVPGCLLDIGAYQE